MGLLNNIFGKKKVENKGTRKLNQTKMINGLVPVFSYLNSCFESDIYSTALESQCIQCSKLRITAKTIDAETGLEIRNKDNRFNEILELRPNPLQTSSEFLQQVAYQYFGYNAAFIYLNYDRDGNLLNMWVVDSSNIVYFEDNSGNQWLRFYVNTIGTVEVELQQMLVIQRNIRSNRNPIFKVLEVINTNDNGIVNAINQSAFIRFIVEYNMSLAPDRKKEKAEAFYNEWLKGNKTNESNFGVIVADALEKIVQVNSNAKYESATDMKEIYKRVYAYLGTNESVVNNDYTEQQMEDVINSSIEPFAIKLAQEMTYKLFTQKGRSQGNKIEIELDKLANMSMQSRLRGADILAKLPINRPNDVFKLMYLPQTEDGEKYYSTLNYVQTDKQNEYQEVGNGEYNDDEIRQMLSKFLSREKNRK